LLLSVEGCVPLLLSVERYVPLFILGREVHFSSIVDRRDESVSDGSYSQKHTHTLKTIHTHTHNTRTQTTHTHLSNGEMSVYTLDLGPETHTHIHTYKHVYTLDIGSENSHTNTLSSEGMNVYTVWFTTKLAVEMTVSLVHYQTRSRNDCEFGSLPNSQ
jgi:hypothetical protein